MEYIFNTHRSQDRITILLSEFNMSVQCGLDERLIAYASITELRLTKTNSAYKAIISIDGSKQIEISNRLYHADGKTEDRSRQFETFIRVLHFHLKEKSNTRFVAGCSWMKAIGATLVAILFSIGLSYGLDWIKLSFVDPFTMSLLFSALTLGFLVATFWPLLPKQYNPTEIPSQYLP